MKAVYILMDELFYQVRVNCWKDEQIQRRIMITILILVINSNFVTFIGTVFISDIAAVKGAEELVEIVWIHIQWISKR